MIEISIKVSGDDRTLTQKFLLHHEGLCLSHDDLKMNDMVKLTTDQFVGVVEDVLIRVKYTW